MPTGQQYATNVPQTTLSAGITAAQTSITVASSSGWPPTPFTAVIDIGLSTQEPVDVSNVSGTTWTITRNIDSTTGFSHASGASVTHSDIGRDFREARAHIDASSSNDTTGHAVHGLTSGSAVVGTLDAQTLFSKSLQQPVIQAAGAPSTPPPSGSVTLYTLSGCLLQESADSIAAVVSPNASDASLMGLVGWTFDPASTASSAQLASSGIASYSRINLYSIPGGSLSNFSVRVNTGGSGLTAGQCFLGLYKLNSLGTVLTQVAVSADISAVVNTSGFKTISFTGSASVTPGIYFVAMLINGTTAPLVTAATNNFVTPSGTQRQYSAGSTATTLPASVNVSSLSSTGNPVGWFGVS